MRRSLGVALWTMVGLLACFMGALSALVGTGAGRALLARAAETALHEAFTGSIEVGDVGGSVLTGVTLSQVRLFDADSTLVAWLPRADIVYNPFDFAAGRVVLFEFRLRQPVINIVQHKNGRLNIEELLRLGRGKEERPDTGAPRPAKLILFRNVRIDDGSVTLRLQAPTAAAGDTAHEIAHGPDGRVRVRRFEHLDTRLSVLQISSPRERGIRFEVSRLAVESSDPVAQIVDLSGRLRTYGDTLELDLARVRLPGSALRTMRGRISWPRDTLLFDLALRADSATLRDIRFIDARFGGDGGKAVVAGGVQLRSQGGRVLEVELDPLRLDWGGGTATGRVTALSAADSGLVALRDADLETRDFDLEFARPFLDTLPFAGRLNGHTAATGPLSALALQVEWTFRDSLVAGWPETHIRGTGEVNLDAGDGIHFQPFTVEAAAVDLRTVQRLVPQFPLRGTLHAAGTLRGPLQNVEFTGLLEHRDDTRPPSRITGSVRLDSRTDPLGISADVTADSLSFDGLKGSFSALPLSGAVVGPVKLNGTLAVLAADVQLHGAGGAGGGGGGTLEGKGELLLGRPQYGVRDFTLRARDLDLGRWVEGAPASRLAFSARGGVAGDSATPPVGSVQVTLGPSLFAGAALDSGAARVRFADRRLYVDSLRVVQPGVVASGSGSLGWSRGTRGALELDVDADSLHPLESLVSWLADGGSEGTGGSQPVADGKHDGLGPPPPLSGAARVLLRIDGSLDSLGLDARATGERLQWRDWEVTAMRARLAYRQGPVPTFELEATLDSLGVGLAEGRGVPGFGAAAVTARGTRDSVVWFARSRVGAGGGFLAGGRFARRSPRVPGPPNEREGKVVAVGLDSLALSLPGDMWVLEQPVELTLSDSAASVSRLVLQSARGPGRFELEGDVPARGRVNAQFHVERFPLVGVYALLDADTAGVGGTIRATVALAGTRADPVSRGSFSLSDGSFGTFRAPFFNGTFEYRDRRLDADLHLGRSGQDIMSMQAHLPLDLALVPVAQRQLPDTLSVRATADSVDLSVLEAVTPALQRVVGVFSANLGIAGTWDTPRLRGTLEIAGAAATVPALGVRYEEINGSLALSGDTITLRALSVRSEGGRGDVSGVMRLERLTRPVLDLRITADRFTALNLRNNVTITASGELALKGPVFGSTLTGRAKVTSGVLYFADLVQKRIVNLDDLVDTSLASIVARQRLGPEFQNVFLDSLRIDELELEMGSDVWLRSNEANIQLAGTAQLTKERNLYLVSGTLQAARGTYRLKVGPVSREFVVTQGTVRYFGTPDQDAALDIEAKHVVHPVPIASQSPEDITVVAHITGTLLVPKVTLEAEKRDLSQTEIISYLLFGKSSVDLAGGQGSIADQRALLRSALSVLSGEIEQTIVSGGVPVDYVEIRPGGGGQGDNLLLGWQFAVGRQLGPKTFLVLNAGFCEGRQVGVRNTLGLSLQFRISPEWRTEASFEPVQTCADPGTEAQGGTVPRQVGLDVFWEKRY